MGTNEVLAIALAALKKGGGGGGGTSNYNSLSNKPQINGVTLQGNKSSADLNIFDASTLIALEFDATQDYPVGDVVIHEHKLYQFISPHTTDDPWDVSEVVEVTVAELIGNVPTAIEISQADYDALSSAEKHDMTKIYYIYDAPGGGGDTKDYNDLENKPQINGVTLAGNKTSEDLGIYSLTQQQLADLMDII